MLSELSVRAAHAKSSSCYRFALFWVAGLSHDFFWWMHCAVCLSSCSKLCLAWSIIIFRNIATSISSTKAQPIISLHRCHQFARQRTGYIDVTSSLGSLLLMYNMPMLRAVQLLHSTPVPTAQYVLYFASTHRTSHRVLTVNPCVRTVL